MVSFTTAARRATKAKKVNTNVRSKTHRNRPQGRGEGCEPPPASCGPGSGRRLRWRQRAAERPARAGKDLGRQPEGMVLFLDHRPGRRRQGRSEEHTSEIQSLLRISYAVFCLKKKIN